MKIVILGANGQIGSVIYNKLKLHTTFEIVGTSRAAIEGLIQFNPFKDDWSVFKKVDVLINSIGQIVETDSCSFEHIHIDVSRLILKNRKLMGNPKIIQLSALGASINHPLPFMYTKAIADNMVLTHPNTLIIRPSIICTHLTTMVKKMLMLRKISKYSNNILFLPKGLVDYCIQPVMPDDLDDIILNLCKAKNESGIIDVVGPERLTYGKIIDVLFKANQEQYKIIEVSRSLMDRFIKTFMFPLFPSVINQHEYTLLFSDNVSDKELSEKYLGKSLSSTLNFWQHEFEN